MSSAQGSDAQGAGAQGSVAQGQNCLGAGHGVGRGICRSFAISSAILRQASVLEANCCNCFAMSWGGPPNRRASGGGRTINMFSMDFARENITYKLSHQLSILWFRWHGGPNLTIPLVSVRIAFAEFPKLLYFLHVSLYFHVFAIVNVTRTFKNKPNWMRKPRKPLYVSKKHAKTEINSRESENRRSVKTNPYKEVLFH